MKLGTLGTVDGTAVAYTMVRSESPPHHLAPYRTVYTLRDIVEKFVFDPFLNHSWKRERGSSAEAQQGRDLSSTTSSQKISSSLSEPMSEIGEKIGLSTAESRVVCNVAMKKKILDELGSTLSFPHPPGRKATALTRAVYLIAKYLNRRRSPSSSLSSKSGHEALRRRVVHTRRRQEKDRLEQQGPRVFPISSS